LEKLSRHYGTIQELRQAKMKELEMIEGIGPLTAEAIVTWFSRRKNRAFVEKLESVGVNLKGERHTPHAVGPLENTTFVFTGTLSQPRREIAILIEEYGGRVMSNVSRNTDFLVVGNSPGRTKVSRAHQLGTPVINEEQLRAMTAAENGTPDRPASQI
jgi:DNA ligase (NAD+)